MKKITLIFYLSIISVCSYSQNEIETSKQLSNKLVDHGADLADKNDWVGAIESYNNAIAFNSKNAMAYFDRGIAKQNLEDYRGAILDYSETINLEPFNAQAFYGRGVCYGKLGNKEKLCLDLSKSGELGNREAYNVIRYVCN